MNAYLNYCIEVNLGFIAVLGFYVLILRHETNFGFNRTFILMGILTSLLFPLISFPFVIHSIPTIGQVIPQLALPPSIPIVQSVIVPLTPKFNLWTVIPWIYMIVSIVLVVVLFIRLIGLILFIRKWKETKHQKGFHVIETDRNLPTFSFFHFIFIGRSTLLSGEEKELIVQHEIIHIQKLHSADVLLMESLKILFWFNPAVYYLKSVLCEVHEFQADQLAAQKGNIDEYCHLLTKVALQSAEFRFVNHFNSSLTIKRIGVLKGRQTKLSLWKIVSVAPFIAGLFFFMACQDQLSQRGNTDLLPSISGDRMPIAVQENLDRLQKIYPKSTFVAIEKTEEGNKTLKQISLRKDVGTFSSIPVFEDSVRRDFIIVELTDRILRRKSLPKNETEIFVQVDEPAAPIFGIDQLYTNIDHVLQYPEEAKAKGIEGTVEVKFVVGTDGKIFGVEVARGIDPYLDAEAIRVLYQVGENWEPAILKGQVVRQRIQLPISFSLASPQRK